MGEMYTFTVFSSCFVDQATYHNSQQILMYTMAQKTSFGVRMCLLSIRSVKIESKQSKSPKSCSVGKSHPKRKRPKIPYNFVI